MKTTRTTTTKKKGQHALFWQLLKMMPGVNEAWRDTIKEGLVWEASGHRTTSLSELWEKYPAAYSEMIEAMKGNSCQRAYRYENQTDTARKRVIAAIAKYLDRCSYNFNSREAKLDYIRRVACRAANCSDFNRIPLSRLQSIYNQYCQMNRADVRGRAEIDYPPSKN